MCPLPARGPPGGAEGFSLWATGAGIPPSPSLNKARAALRAGRPSGKADPHRGLELPGGKVLETRGELVRTTRFTGGSCRRGRAGGPPAGEAAFLETRLVEGKAGPARRAFPGPFRSDDGAVALTLGCPSREHERRARQVQHPNGKAEADDTRDREPRAPSAASRGARSGRTGQLGSLLRLHPPGSALPGSGKCEAQLLNSLRARPLDAAFGSGGAGQLWTRQGGRARAVPSAGRP